MITLIIDTEIEIETFDVMSWRDNISIQKVYLMITLGLQTD